MHNAMRLAVSQYIHSISCCGMYVTSDAAIVGDAIVDAYSTVGL